MNFWLKNSHSLARAPENTLQRAFELYRKLAPYKWKYNLQSPEDVVEFLEKKSTDADRRATEAEKRFKDLLDNPEQIFLETVCADLTPINWYEQERKTGYNKGFLDFLAEVVEGYYEDRGLELEERED
jgi:hypothetical protein